MLEKWSMRSASSLSPLFGLGVQHSRFMDSVSLFLVYRSASGAMLLCGVLHTALSVSIGAIVQILIFFLQNSNILRVQASLPPGAEDEIILIEHLPGRRVHLQDFFWSDAKDAPSWLDPNQGLTFYETRTVHHTVTLYSPAEEKDNNVPVFPHRTDSNEPKCTTCIEPTPRLDDDEDQNIGILIGEDPGPRYWLLTVLRAGEAIPPKIELKLARLYRTAFSRQQQRHLGLLQTDTRSRRVEREHALLKSKPGIATQEQIFEKSAISPAKLKIEIHSESQDSTIPKPVKMVDVPDLKNSLPPASTVNNTENPNEEIQMYDFQFIKQLFSDNESVAFNTNTSTTPISVDFNENITDYASELYVQYNESLNNLQDFSENPPTSEKQVLNKIDTKKRSEGRSLDHTRGETVQVRMQNTSVTEGGATKLIYSVHLGGKPVPAETAARDMALLSPQEVALELGAPVLIQSEPYLREAHPLALSRKRDAWLLIGAASAGFILLGLVVAGLILAAKRKRALSAVAAPPSRNVLKKKREYAQASAGLDNAFSTSEMDLKTDGTSQRPTPRTLSRTPVSLETADSLEEGIHEVSSDDEEQKRKARDTSSWEHPRKKSRLTHARIPQTSTMDTPRTSDSTDVIVDHLETLDSLENNYSRQEDATASPHSYLSMPSCKQFPSMKSVEPLSRVLEPVMIKHLDIDSPELVRRDNDHTGVYRDNELNYQFFTRTSSAIKDPGVVGPIVWNLRRQNLSEGNGTSETDADVTCVAPSGPVGRARRRLHELLEDSFSLFGSRDPKSEVQSCATRPNSAVHTPDVLTIFSETKERPYDASPVSSIPTEMMGRPRTSLAAKPVEESVAKNGPPVPTRSRSNWGSRPLSAGPFHRPNIIPAIDTRRILTDCQLPPEDPAVPLIASIKRELEKFSPQ